MGSAQAGATTTTSPGLYQDATNDRTSSHCAFVGARREKYTCAPSSSSPKRGMSSAQYLSHRVQVLGGSSTGITLGKGLPHATARANR